MKKLLCLGLAATMILSCLAGCGKNGNNVGQITKEELDPDKIGYYSTLELPLDTEGTTIRAFLKSQATDPNSSVAIKELSRRTGLNIKIETAPPASYVEKGNVLMAAKKNLPDIIGEINVNDFAIQGAFEPIDEHFDELPNLKEMFIDKAEEFKTVDFLKGLYAEDGHLYKWPVWDIQREVEYGLMYRRDIFEKHGIEMWNSTEEFYQVLKKLKELYPDSSPLTSKRGTLIFVEFMQMWNIRSVQSWTPYYDEESGLWKQCLTDPKMKEILDFMKKIYDEGLLDPEFLTMTEAAWTSKMTQEAKGFITYDHICRMQMWNTQTDETLPHFNLRYANPIGEGKMRTLDRVWGNLGVTKSDRSLLALKLLDYCFSDSGTRLLTLGIEGETYEKGADGYVDYIGYDKGTSVEGGDLEEKYGLFTALSNRYDKKSSYFRLCEEEHEAVEIMRAKENNGLHPFDPMLVFTGEEEAVRNEVQPILKTAAEEFYSKYILSDDPKETGDAAWESWLKKAQSLGSDELVEVYNKAQKRYDAM